MNKLENVLVIGSMLIGGILMGNGMIKEKMNQIYVGAGLLNTSFVYGSIRERKKLKEYFKLK